MGEHECHYVPVSVPMLLHWPYNGIVPVKQFDSEN
jgi:hypothetical protein